ncbi:MAG: hypothetical protein F2881_00765 [Actinobacteria bacterium]|uniref:Unannotated protein n=1 Tax=freshwater metagenome TaxID=449393 RepID=A0A6J7NQC5_9ZZZZ|nr:hypothetical protein [Actinomycetota bacterium]
MVDSPIPGTLRVDLFRIGTSAALPDRDSFGWTVLHALVDSVAVADSDGEVHLVLTATSGMGHS